MSRRNPKKIRPYKKQFIIKVPVAETFDYPKRETEDDPVTAGDDIEALKIQFLGDVPNTREVNGKKLVIGMGSCKQRDLQSMIATHNLDWTISGFEGKKIVKNRILSHLLPDVVITEDEQGNEVITEVPVTDITNRLPAISGKNWEY